MSLLFVTAAATVTPQVLKESVKEWERQQFAAEYEMLLRVSHPNILRLLAFSNDGPHRCLLMELATGGSLEDRLACRGALDFSGGQDGAEAAVIIDGRAPHSVLLEIFTEHGSGTLIRM